jgi:small subunit ribosomal protein S1
MPRSDRWDAADEKRRTHQPVEAQVNDANRGGLIVGLLGLRAYLPGTQLTPDVAGDWKQLVGQRILVEILDVNRRRNRVIVRQVPPPT